jgi:hypothetical protein
MWDEKGGLIGERDGEMAPRECGAPGDGTLVCLCQKRGGAAV